MAWHKAPMCGPAISARRSSCCVLQRCSCGTILLLNAVPAALLPQVLAEQLPGERIDQPYLCGIPLHVNPASDPAWRRAIVCGLDFDAAVQMHGPLAVEVIAKRLAPAEAATPNSRPRTSRPLASWSSRESASRPTAPHSDPGTPALPPRSRSADPSTAFSAHGRRRIRPSLSDPDLARGTQQSDRAVMLSNTSR